MSVAVLFAVVLLTPALGEPAGPQRVQPTGTDIASGITANQRGPPA